MPNEVSFQSVFPKELRFCFSSAHIYKYSFRSFLLTASQWGASPFCAMTELGQDPSSGQTLTTPFFRLIFIPTKIETCSYTTHRQFNQLLPPQLAVNSFYSFYQLCTFVEINIFALITKSKICIYACQRGVSRSNRVFHSTRVRGRGRGLENTNKNVWNKLFKCWNTDALTYGLVFIGWEAHNALYYKSVHSLTSLASSGNTLYNPTIESTLQHTGRQMKKKLE